MANDLLDQGLTLMLAGMGTVFVFLTALVAVTSLMSRIILHLESEIAAEQISDDEVAAISAAIEAYRRK